MTFNGGRTIKPGKADLSQESATRPGIVQAVIQWAFKLRGLLTYEKPVEEFPGDLTFTGPLTVTLRSGLELPKNCTGFRLINVTGTTSISINGGGLRTVRDADVVDGSVIATLILNITAGACTVQPWGVGD